jgi:hypothetical protein
VELEAIATKDFKEGQGRQLVALELAVNVVELALLRI